jgi:hypothetical protein
VFWDKIQNTHHINPKHVQQVARMNKDTLNEVIWRAEVDQKNLFHELPKIDLYSQSPLLYNFHHEGKQTISWAAQNTMVISRLLSVCNASNFWASFTLPTPTPGHPTPRNIGLMVCFVFA